MKGLRIIMIQPQSKLGSPYKVLSFFLLFILCMPSFLFAEPFHSGQTVVLKATKPIGVPLHKKAEPSYWKHVADLTPVTIQQIDQTGKWLFILLPSGERAWVNKKYVQAQTMPSKPTVSPQSNQHHTDSQTDSRDHEQEVWASRQSCLNIVKNGGRMAKTSPHLRLATWNIRWFPVGQPQDQQGNQAKPTDLEWMACVMQWMQVDILSIQESLATSRANLAWKRVTTLLTEQTGNIWKWYRQPCGRSDGHHIGFLWNASQVTLSNFSSLWQLNAKSESGKDPCAGGLRPGQYAWVKSQDPHGVDFHLIAVHLKSGPTVFAVEDRHKALNQIDQVVKPLLQQDQDVVILGDFNTMGAGDRRSQLYEVKALKRKVGNEAPGFQDLPISPQCTHYFRGRGSWLDHVLATKSMEEMITTSARVSGYCEVANCKKIRGDYPQAYRSLSDHCPIVVEIKNEDKD
jgi:endonuclease/exonuclease/phosphatase family metal-dependent hydrolase